MSECVTENEIQLAATYRALAFAAMSTLSKFSTEPSTCSAQAPGVRKVDVRCDLLVT